MKHVKQQYTTKSILFTCSDMHKSCLYQIKIYAVYMAVGYESKIIKKSNIYLHMKHT